jgi:DNA-binding NtrC family response regulator
MQTYRPAGTVILVSTRRPDVTVAQDIQAHGLEMQWAASIRAAIDLLHLPCERAIVVTELALADGNWRDLVERVSTRMPIPIVLMTAASTAELWWDALECGVDDILHTPLEASRLCQLLQTHYAP